MIVPQTIVVKIMFRGEMMDIKLPVIHMKLLSFLFLIVFLTIFILVQVFANIQWWNRFLTSNNVALLQTSTMDYLLALSLFLSFISNFFYNYSVSKHVKKALSKSIFYYSLFIAVLIWFDVEIMNSSTLGFSIRTSGFPWWEERVMAVSCFIKAPGFTNVSPNCYFINYAELFLISVITAITGYYFSHMKHAKRKSPISSGNNLIKAGKAQDYRIMKNIHEYFKVPLIIIIIITVLILAYFVNYAPVPKTYRNSSIVSVKQNSIGTSNFNNFNQNRTEILYGNWAVDFGSYYGINWWGSAYSYQTPSGMANFTTESQAISWLNNNGHPTNANITENKSYT